LTAITSPKATAVRPDAGAVGNRAPLDGIDAVLVAYLLDIDQSTERSDADTAESNHSTTARPGSDGD
jgi:hypothetical protein